MPARGPEMSATTLRLPEQVPRVSRSSQRMTRLGANLGGLLSQIGGNRSQGIIRLVLIGGRYWDRTSGHCRVKRSKRATILLQCRQPLHYRVSTARSCDAAVFS
jgi:hypothetical protein